MQFFKVSKFKKLTSKIWRIIWCPPLCYGCYYNFMGIETLLRFLKFYTWVLILIWGRFSVKLKILMMRKCFLLWKWQNDKCTILSNFEKKRSQKLSKKAKTRSSVIWKLPSKHSVVNVLKTNFAKTSEQKFPCRKQN